MPRGYLHERPAEQNNQKQSRKRMQIWILFGFGSGRGRLVGLASQLLGKHSIYNTAGISARKAGGDKTAKNNQGNQCKFGFCVLFGCKCERMVGLGLQMLRKHIICNTARISARKAGGHKTAKNNQGNWCKFRCCMLFGCKCERMVGLVL